MTPLEYFLVGGALLLLLGIGASKASELLGVPALLLFLLIGMLAGSEGPGGIPFENVPLAQRLGVVALAFILFSGGQDTRWEEVRRVLWNGISLSTLGVLLTALLVGVFAWAALGFTLLQGLLLGAIVSSTDAAAVFSVLKARSVSLRGRLRPLLELESGSNDPMAVFLTIGFTGLLMGQNGASALGLVPAFLLQMSLGAALGLAMGHAMVWVINHIRLEYEGLYPVLTLALVLFTYGVTAALGGNGFLAVYLAGLVMGNQDFIHRKSLMRFHDGLAWLMQITMFLTLGLLVQPSALVEVVGAGLAVSGFLMFVARPASIFASLPLARMHVRAKVFVSWVGLRGAVPIILATFPLLEGVEGAQRMFDLVFFIVLTSVLLQGTTIRPVARLLRVDAPMPRRTVSPLEFIPTSKLESQLIEVALPDEAASVGKEIIQLHLPEGTLIVLVGRNERFLVPRGGTVLEHGDTLLVLVPTAKVEEVRGILTRPQEEPAPSGQA